MKAVAQRYASALADVAVERGTTKEVLAELAGFVRLLGESAELQNFLASPAVPRASKQGAIEKILARLGAGPTLRNFLFVVVENRRLALLGQIQQAFEALLDARMGIAEAVVTSVGELSAEEKTELNRVLERRTGKKIRARYEFDSALIGGAIVRIGSTIYDGSVRAQLHRLETQLTSE